MAYSNAKMQQEQIGWFQQTISWLNVNWEHIAGFGIASQLIDRFFKWLTKRSESRIKELMKTEIKDNVMPDIIRLTESINGLKESMYALNDKIVRIK